jgi:hypothetical protein
MASFPSVITIPGQSEQFVHYRTFPALRSLTKFRTRCPISYILVNLVINDLKASIVREHESTHITPCWMKAIGIIVIALLLVFASLHLMGRRFFGDGGHGVNPSPSSVNKHGLQQPSS